MVGWPFLFVYLGVPYISPLLAIVSAWTASYNLIKTMGNLNAIMIMFNIPLTVLLSWKNGEDPIYYLVLFLMMAMKVMISVLSSKVMHYMTNPRFCANDVKLKKILSN